MCFWGTIEQRVKLFMNWLYQRSIVCLAAILGVFLTLFITVVHCIVTFWFSGGISIFDVIQPLCYGALLPPFVVFFFSQISNNISLI